MNDDPQLWSNEKREAVLRQRAMYDAFKEACTRRRMSAAEAVSMDALCEQYPQVRRLVEAAKFAAGQFEFQAMDEDGLGNPSGARRARALANKLRDAAEGK